MQFRERESSSSVLGFRVEGVKVGANPGTTDFKKVRTRDDVCRTPLHPLAIDAAQVKKALTIFFPPAKSMLHDQVRTAFVARLHILREALLRSRFFKVPLPSWFAQPAHTTRSTS